MNEQNQIDVGDLFKTMGIQTYNINMLNNEVARLTQENQKLTQQIEELKNKDK